MKRFFLITSYLTLLCAQAFAFELYVSDQPNDDGTRLAISWDPLPPDELRSIDPESYLLLRSEESDGEYIQVDIVSSLDPSREKIDEKLTEGQTYFYNWFIPIPPYPGNRT